MRRFMSMLWFHLRLFSGNAFFVQLMVTSTLSVLALQLLALRGADGVATGGDIWLRSGMAGAWSVSTVAAGIIFFQRAQGTLVHLTFTPAPIGTAMLPVVGAASTFGLLAFPLAAGASALVGVTPRAHALLQLAAGIPLFWVACLSISCVVAGLFILTPNAFTYEGLLAVPLILLSGIFGSALIPTWARWLGWLLPTRSGVEVLLTPGFQIGSALTALALSALWLTVAGVAQSRALRRARVSGTLELI